MAMKWALPVWEEGKEREMNWFLRLRAEIGPQKALLRVAACNLYRVFVNGEFVCQGPARAGHGCYRVDEVEIPGGSVEIQVGAYNVNAFEYLDEPGFIQCEIERDGEMLAATGISGFTGFSMKEKQQKVQRFSFQRMFCEEYQMPAEEAEISLAVQPAKRLVPRGIPMERWPVQEIHNIVGAGTVSPGHQRENYYHDRQIDGVSPVYKGYTKEELGRYLNQEVEEMDFSPCKVPDSPMELEKDTYRILDMGREYTGYIGAHLTVREAAVVYFLFDELLVDGDVNFNRLGSTAAVKYTLAPGEYRLQSIEPYGFRYLKIVVLEGTTVLHRVFLRRSENPADLRPYGGNDPELAEIYDAAAETFRQNSPDIFMDCPTRERAGWLCDSFFTGRAEYFLTRKNDIEHNFLENFLHCDHYQFLPKEMLPMCYPSDHNDGTFIPNWAMWLVLELEEYQNRTGDHTLVLDFHSRIQSLLEYLSRFENEDGLLEDLESWVMVEWSKCNELTDGVNYPTNMLYYRTLRTVSRLYGDAQAEEKAESVRKNILAQSFDGEFFAEQALRRDGTLQVGAEITETCQYYAFFSGVATPETYPALWRTMLTKFGPHRKEHNEYPAVYFSNAFIGNYLRLELLYQAGEKQQLTQEIREFFLHMARTTGTLWEHMDTQASCNHGFASTVVCWIE